MVILIFLIGLYLVEMGGGGGRGDLEVPVMLMRLNIEPIIWNDILQHHGSKESSAKCEAMSVP